MAEVAQFRVEIVPPTASMWASLNREGIVKGIEVDKASDLVEGVLYRHAELPNRRVLVHRWLDANSELYEVGFVLDNVPTSGWTYRGIMMNLSDRDACWMYRD